MATIKVTSGELLSVSADLQAGSDDVSQRLLSMRSRVQALVDADWAGAASDSFRDLWERWHAGAHQLQEALVGISEMLGQTARIYEETEEQLARKLRG
ncbi:MAG: WXG100 family type VII secretion target [Acidimicrobiia bacterium]